MAARRTRLTTLADVTSARELAKWATETGDGHVDILVNNAGTALLGPSESGTEAEFDETFTINVKVPFFLVAALAPAMAARVWGTIVNISTMVAGFGGPGMAMYGASRAALELLTRAWAAEYGPRGVRVNAVAPGPVRTPMNEGVGDIPQQVAALCATLNISGYGITAPPARSVAVQRREPIGMLLLEAGAKQVGEQVVVSATRRAPHPAAPGTSPPAWAPSGDANAPEAFVASG